MVRSILIFLERPGEPLHRLFLHGGQDVRVDIERHGNLA